MSVWDENIYVVVHPLNEFSTRMVDAMTNSSNWLDLYDIVFYHNTRNDTLSFKVRYRRTSKKALTPSDFHFLNQNVLVGAILFFWNQYSNRVRTKLSSTALTVRVIIKK